MNDLVNRKVLVTGASRGIGRAIAHAFAVRGAQVALNYRDNDAAAAEAIDSLSGSGHCLVKADLSMADGALRVVERAIAGLSGLDTVINNAGIFEHHPPASTAFAEWMSAWQATLAINLTGPANVCWAAAQHMITAGGGHIINVTSRGAFRGEPNAPAYGASKAGLNSLTQSLAVALAPHAIYVAAVAPGFVETDMAATSLTGESGKAIRAQSPLGRVARPEEVASAVLFLASPGAEFATGAIIDVNGASYLRS
ncbi:MAG: SDR family oxidoreductase [Halioglobus sp.]|nr:SDR family oxidoreductase [Halioglobus sp.]